MNNSFSKIITWQPILTDHQSYTLNAFAELSGLELEVNVSKLEDVDRIKQGWRNSDIYGVERNLIPRIGFLKYGIKKLIKNKEEIHIFCNSFGDKRFFILLLIAAIFNLHVYVISEPYSNVAYGYQSDEPYWKSRGKLILRPYLYRLYVLLLRAGLKGVFAISDLALNQFISAGMPENKLFPFGYFVPTITSDYSDAAVLDDRLKAPIRIAFVGNLIERKGITQLIEVVNEAIAGGIDLELSVFGPGCPENLSFESDRVRYLGAIPFGRTQHELVKFDLLALPSFYDGWGVVVNEALCAGIPVVCSDNVGASVLIRKFSAGLIFPAGDKKSLLSIFDHLWQNPSALRVLKANCSNARYWIQPCIAGDYMMKKVCESVDGVNKVLSPWYPEKK